MINKIILIAFTVNLISIMAVYISFKRYIKNSIFDLVAALLLMITTFTLWLCLIYLIGKAFA